MESLLAKIKAELLSILAQLKAMETTELWDTPSHIRRNVRVMCDEAGLSTTQKNTLCACIRQESQWNPRIVSKPNTNGTRDWGLVQINDNKGYWIGEGLYFASTDEVLDNPKKCAEFMIMQFKKGRAWYWASYNSGAYRKWLVSESLPSLPY